MSPGARWMTGWTLRMDGGEVKSIDAGMGGGGPLFAPNSLHATHQFGKRQRDDFGALYRSDSGNRSSARWALASSIVRGPAP